MNQPTAAPTRKVTAAMIAGAIVTLLSWLLGFGDVELPGDVAAALTTIIMVVAAYTVPEGDL